jgi:hypothetical protein
VSDLQNPTAPSLSDLLDLLDEVKFSPMSITSDGTGKVLIMNSWLCTASSLIGAQTELMWAETKRTVSVSGRTKMEALAKACHELQRMIEAGK